MRRWVTFGIAIAACAGGAALLVLLDGAGATLGGWFGYAVVLAVGASILWGGYHWIAQEPGSRSALAPAVIAWAVRLVVGLTLLRALPLFGYDEAPQQAGYVFRDAFHRDRRAWELAQAGQPLQAFGDASGTDQYGGLLFLSAGLYRILGFGVHRPMLVAGLGAAVSALGVMATWGFARRAFGGRAASLSAWIMAVYPEAVLLGASQMREPYLITALAAGLYAYGIWRSERGRWRQGLPFILLLAGCIPISPPFVFALLLALGGGRIWEGHLRTRQSRGVLAVLVVLAVVAALIAVQAWMGIGPLEGTPLEVLRGWWQNVGGDWRLNLVSSQSHWMDNLLSALPNFAKLPFLVVFGLLQPFLPASLLDPGAPIWRIIAIARSLGWFAMLPLLIYAPVLAMRKAGWRSLAAYLALLTWAVSLVASYRAPGYQWDNPRYRTAYLAVAAVAAAWTWVIAGGWADRWVRRLYAITGLSALVVSHWYLGRHYGTPKLSLPATLVLTLVLIAGYLAAMIWRDRVRAPSV